MSADEFEILATTPTKLLEEAQTWKFKPNLFAMASFMNLISQSIPVHSFCLRRKSDNCTIGIGHFGETSPGIFSSPGRGSFGGLQIDTSLNLDDSFCFARWVDDFLRERGARKIKIVLPPMDYGIKAGTEALSCWLRLGFAIDRMEINYAISIGPRDYSELAAHSVRKRIKKCLRSHFQFAELPASSLREAYNVIALNRASKGYPMTMSFEALSATIRAMTPRIRIFGVRDGERLIAASLVYEINDDIEYVFYWGDSPGYEQSSPITLLASFLYERAQREGRKLLDLGISTVEGEPNSGLIRFKTNLGAKASPKFILSKSV